MVAASRLEEYAPNLKTEDPKGYIVKPKRLVDIYEKTSEWAKEYLEPKTKAAELYYIKNKEDKAKLARFDFDCKFPVSRKEKRVLTKIYFVHFKN